MSYATYKGWSGEDEAAKFFDSLVAPDHHICRLGGVEKQKHVFAGDVCIVGRCNKHQFFGQKDHHDCALDPFFIEVKNQAAPNIWGSMLKAEDDAELANKAGVIGYFIKTPRNTKGERLVVMRPETLKRLLQK